MKILNRILIIIFTISLFNNITTSQWVTTTSGTTNFLNSVQSINAVTNYAAGFTGTVLKSTNSGQTWSALTSPVIANINKVYFPPTGTATTGWVGSASGVYKTTNGGVNWVQQIGSGAFSDIFFTDLNTGIALRTNNIFFKTTNGGTNFTQFNFSNNSLVQGSVISFAGGSNLYLLAVDNVNDTTFVFKSANTGDSWTQIFKTPGIYFDMEFINLNTGLMCGSNGTVKITTNGGTVWTSINAGTTNNLLGIEYASSNIVYMVGASGTILKSTSGGSFWFPQLSPVIATLRSIQVFPADDNGIIVGGGGNIVRTTNGGNIPTGINPVSGEIPQNFSLSQNYPNPFNPSTKINFAISPSYMNNGLQPLVRLSLFDIVGREVAVLANENLSPGNYSIDFDASSLSTGTYFYRLTAGEFSQTNKMVLIK
ncbi:MAG: T9SS type A sorting domain-containing protein [Ignavibacteria bacterium]